MVDARECFEQSNSRVSHMRDFINPLKYVNKNYVTTDSSLNFRC